ncbi:hypothetical protein [Niabella beijingensis]|uniref:hypothetical protein n=1 Tax=Niabella beijingensis TaxID=2872700 RepID=UPI0023E44A32|nr:hypothetical protein [Niabella beijingensis]
MECPRCLGKGHVDEEDIKRLRQELKWTTGPCAYCEGTGTIDRKLIENIPADAAFLVMDLPAEERKKMLSGNPDAIERGRQYADHMEHFISQINYLHFDAGLQVLQIARFYLIGAEGSLTYETEKKDLVEYIERVIQYKEDNG